MRVHRPARERPAERDESSAIDRAVPAASTTSGARLGPAGDRRDQQHADAGRAAVPCTSPIPNACAGERRVAPRARARGRGSACLCAVQVAMLDLAVAVGMHVEAPGASAPAAAPPAHDQHADRHLGCPLERLGQWASNSTTGRPNGASVSAWPPPGEAEPARAAGPVRRGRTRSASRPRRGGRGPTRGAARAGARPAGRREPLAAARGRRDSRQARTRSLPLAQRAAATAACPYEIPPSFGGSRSGTSTRRPSPRAARAVARAAAVLEDAARQHDRVDARRAGRAAGRRRGARRGRCGSAPTRSAPGTPRSRSPASARTSRARPARAAAPASGSG